jgi:predicted nucleic acid-binding protein
MLYAMNFSNLSDWKKDAVIAQLDATPTIPIDEGVIQACVRLRTDCRRARPSSHALQDKVHCGDLWIAATAISLGAPLLSTDGIFANAPGLSLLTV